VTATLRASGLRATATRGLPPGEARLEVRRAGSGAVNATAEARLGPQQRLAATARFPQGPGAAQPFEATLDGALDLAQLSAPFLAAGADRVGGALALALRASGTPAEPVLGGEARLSGGRYRNGVLGIAITDIAGTLRPDGPRLRADITGRTQGEGRIALAGTIEPMTRFLPLDLTLTATNAQPISSDLLRATLDAELRLAGQLGTEATLSGPVRIRRAELRIPDRIGGGVRSLGPVTERGTPRGRAPAPAAQPVREAAPAPADAGPPILLAVQVIAPRAVHVRGRGLEAELGGEIAVRGRIAAPEISGALELRRGEITLAGRRLEFDRGRLAWDGALLPDLNLRASNQSGSYTARVEVMGPPTSPEIVFSAVPELPPDEVLARLFFDRPLRELSPLRHRGGGAHGADARSRALRGRRGLCRREAGHRARHQPRRRARRPDAAHPPRGRDRRPGSGQPGGSQRRVAVGQVGQLVGAPSPARTTWRSGSGIHSFSSPGTTRPMRSRAQACFASSIRSREELTKFQNR
jgi:translocation and assembly module TamB